MFFGLLLLFFIPTGRATPSKSSLQKRVLPTVSRCPHPQPGVAKRLWLARLCDWRMGPLPRFFIDVCSYPAGLPGTTPWMPGATHMLTFINGLGAFDQSFVDHMTNIPREWMRRRLPLHETGLLLATGRCPVDSVCRQVYDQDYDLHIECWRVKADGTWAGKIPIDPDELPGRITATATENALSQAFEGTSSQASSSRPPPARQTVTTNVVARGRRANARRPSRTVTTPSGSRATQTSVAVSAPAGLNPFAQSWKPSTSG